MLSISSRWEANGPLKGATNIQSIKIIFGWLENRSIGTDFIEALLHGGLSLGSSVRKGRCQNWCIVVQELSWLLVETWIVIKNIVAVPTNQGPISTWLSAGHENKSIKVGWLQPDSARECAELSEGSDEVPQRKTVEADPRHAGFGSE